MHSILFGGPLIFHPNSLREWLIGAISGLIVLIGRIGVEWYRKHRHRTHVRERLGREIHRIRNLLPRVREWAEGRRETLWVNLTTSHWDAYSRVYVEVENDLELQGRVAEFYEEVRDLDEILEILRDNETGVLREEGESGISRTHEKYIRGTLVDALDGLQEYTNVLLDELGEDLEPEPGGSDEED